MPSLPTVLLLGFSLCFSSSVIAAHSQAQLNPPFDRVLFEMESSELSEQSIRILDATVVTLRSNRNYTVLVEGHADMSGKKRFNLYLSRLRANTVRNYLVKNGVLPAQIHVTAKGAGSPLETSNRPQEQQRNRRVDLVFIGS